MQLTTGEREIKMIELKKVRKVSRLPEKRRRVQKFDRHWEGKGKGEKAFKTQERLLLKKKRRMKRERVKKKGELASRFAGERGKKSCKAWTGWAGKTVRTSGKKSGGHGGAGKKK